MASEKVIWIHYGEKGLSSGLKHFNLLVKFIGIYATILDVFNH